MQTRTIGDRQVSAIGLAGMPMLIEGRSDEAQSTATVHAALDAGVTLIDTVDAYHRSADEVGHNEELIARAPSSYRSSTDGVLVTTKGGHLRPGNDSWTRNGYPTYIKAPSTPQQDASAWTRSACISSTDPAPRYPAPTRWAGSATCSLTA